MSNVIATARILLLICCITSIMLVICYYTVGPGGLSGPWIRAADDYYYPGVAAYERRDYRKSKDLLREYVEHNGGDPNGHYMLGLCLMGEGSHVREAEAELIEALRINRQQSRPGMSQGRIQDCERRLRKLDAKH